MKKYDVKWPLDCKCFRVITRLNMKCTVNSNGIGYLAILLHLPILRQYEPIWKNDSYLEQTIENILQKCNVNTRENNELDNAAT